MTDEFNELKFPEYNFHGGCFGCTVQNHNIKTCLGCCYFDANWSLPNLNNRLPSNVDLMKIKLKNK